MEKTTQYLKSPDCAALLDVPANSFSRAWKLIKDFPRPIPGGHRLQPKWLESEVIAWKKTLPQNTSPLDIFRKVRRESERPEIHAPRKPSEPRYIDPLIKLSLDFLRGNFATQQQQEIYNQKRAHARRVKPKTKTITVESQW
jgi:predicted DNA-binding transcriptional regulator AlpA